MQIVSRYLPPFEVSQIGRVVVTVFTTLVGPKALVVGLLVGQALNEEVSGVVASNFAGELALQRLKLHRHLNELEVPTLVAEIRDPETAASQVRDVLTRAVASGTVELVCPNLPAYEAVYAALAIEMWPVAVAAQQTQ